jgi:hypothetical protein
VTITIVDAEDVSAAPSDGGLGLFAVSDALDNAGADALASDGLIDPRRVRLFRGPHAVLRCTVEGDRSVLRAKVVRAFPLSSDARWISVLDGKNKEVCLIEDPALLDAESRRLVEEELAQHYRISTIERIVSIKQEYRTMFWDVETDRGRRDFVVKWAADTVQWLNPTELLLVDIDTNRFRIPDVTRLDPHSHRQLAVVL